MGEVLRAESASGEILRVAGLSKRYGDLCALESLDLEVREREIFGLLGPNGAGKTTAISMISCVLTPTAGTVAVGGHDTRRDSFAARRLLGLVPQDLALYEEITARQNLRFFGRLYGLVGDALRGRIGWALDVAGLSDRADEPVTRFSGGMKRRLNLAAGLLHRPRLLVLDEPTVGVDPQSRAHIFDTVRRLRDDDGMAILYTTHYMEEAEALCARVGILDRGRLVALGTIESLKARHAGGAVEVEVEGDPNAAVAALASLGEVATTTGGVRVSGSASLGDVAKALEGARIEVRALSRDRPDLETVFLSLTGRRLRDEP